VTLHARLAQQLVLAHPQRAARVLERVGADGAARVLERVPSRPAAELLACLSPQAAAEVLERLGTERGAEVVEMLDLDVAARVVRRMRPETATAVLGRIPGRRARAIGVLLRFPENSAGALMDPEVLALPEDWSAREALRRIREVPGQARYNLYVVDAQQKLVGALNLRELMLAPPASRISELMVRDPVRLDAFADRAQVVAHPGWARVHAIPVVDEHGGYLGAIRYRTLRALEAALLGRHGEDEDAGRALGELFATGAAGLLDALTGSSPTKSGS
jgi:magnesium transporter